MLRTGRFVAGGSHVLNYGRGGPQSRTTSGEVRRGKTTSGKVRVSIIYPESLVNYLYELKVEKPWGIIVLDKN